ncbi:hypothetical protein PATSB16_30280 [Pandoraea thiooxydans]|nr:hypothetical protein PATSB16_30280 [Pandoraea thiooxydans]
MYRQLHRPTTICWHDQHRSLLIIYSTRTRIPEHPLLTTILRVSYRSHNSRNS